MLEFYSEAMHLLTSEKIRTPDEWLKTRKGFIKKREEYDIGEHFSEIKGTLLFIDSKNEKK